MASEETDEGRNEDCPSASCSALEDALAEIGDSEVDWSYRDFSNRTKKLLGEMGVVTYRDLVESYTSGRLASFKGVGKKTYNEIGDHLNFTMGLKVGYKPNWKPFREQKEWKFDPFTGEKL